MLALYGAKARFDGMFKNAVLTAWLGGMLSQADTRSYPTIESLIGGDDNPPSQPQKIAPEDSAANARAWAAWLNAGKKRKA